jgi:hypothetical protein
MNLNIKRDYPNTCTHREGGPWVHMNVQVMNVPQVTKMGNKNDASCTHVIIQTCKHLLPMSMTDGKPTGLFRTKNESMKKSLVVFTEMGAPSMAVLLHLLITLRNMCHLEL